MVIWSEVAKEDLSHIFSFIANDSRLYAFKVVDEIIELSERLVKFPLIGKRVKELHNNDIREIPVYSYRLIYQVSGVDVQIVTIVHMKRKNFKL